MKIIINVTSYDESAKKSDLLKELAEMILESPDVELNGSINNWSGDLIDAVIEIQSN